MLPDKPALVRGDRLLDVADRQPVSSQWRKEWRRIGGSVVTVASLATITWASATQSFVVLKGNKLVHPALVQWPFILGLVGIGVGSYVVLTTYHDRLPMFGRERDHSSQYALWVLNPSSYTTFNPEQPGVYATLQPTLMVSVQVP